MRTKGINLAAPPQDLTERRDTARYMGAAPAYTSEAIGLRPTDFRRLLSTVESLGAPRAGTTRATLKPQPELTGVRVTEEDWVPYVQARHLYQLRTQSHRFDERQVDAEIENWRTLARRDGLLLADCHHDRMTFLVTPDTTHCEQCGTEY